MKEIRTKGIIIEETPVGEKDKRLIIFTKDYGKITAFANGAKNTKSKFIACTQILCYSEILLIKTKTSYTVKDIELIESFYPIRKDLFKLSYSMVILEIIKQFSIDGQENNDLMYLLLKTLVKIKGNTIDNELILLIFSLKIMSICGYTPVMDQCIFCSNIIKDIYYFSIIDGGIVCSKCHLKRKNLIPINKNTVYTIIYIINSSIGDLYTFTVSDNILNDLNKIVIPYLEYHIEYKLKTLSFIKELT